MDIAVFENVLALGESATVEFKRCGDIPHKDTFETICSFANRSGGSLYLGVEDDGSVSGVDPARLVELQRNVINVVHNLDLFNQPPALEFEQIEYDNKAVLRIWVAPTQGVYRYKGEVYDRVADSDVRLRSDSQISSLYIRKYDIFTEQHIYPALTLDDLDSALIARCRTLAANRHPGHPWASMDDMELLRSAQLYSRDLETGATGFNRACALLLGKYDVVLSACPAYKTDAILRRQDTDRYDDREIIRCNLVSAYDRLRGFCEKHIPDPFFMEGDARISARNIVIRELVSNMLIHREYTNPFPAKLIIGPNGILTENASRAHFEGRIRLSDFNPIPKNPIIANFFTQIGYAEELGSGLRNLERYSRVVFGADPVLVEGDVFRASIEGSLSAGRNEPAVRSANPKTREALLAFVNERGVITVGEAAEAVGISPRTATKYLKALAGEGLIQTDGNIRVHRYSRVDI